MSVPRTACEVRPPKSIASTPRHPPNGFAAHANRTTHPVENRLLAPQKTHDTIVPTSAIYRRPHSVAKIYADERTHRDCAYSVCRGGNKQMREVNLHHFENVLTTTFRRYLFTK